MFKVLFTFAAKPRQSERTTRGVVTYIDLSIHQVEAQVDGRRHVLALESQDCIDPVREIVVLDEGRVKAKGDHETLLQTSPIYKEIFRSQLGEPAQ